MTQPHKRRITQPRKWTTVKDEHGNNMLCGRNEVSVLIKLVLIGEGRRRNIGTIMLKKRELIVKRKRKEHLHWKSNSYGLNDNLIRNAKLFDTVRLIDEHAEYKMKRQDILDKGALLFFKQKGFELQIFMSLETLAKYKVEPKF